MVQVGDAIPLVDLRALGAPVSLYACRVARLVVNGAAVALSRPCLAVLDTGTTGAVFSDTLYESDELPLPGAAIREVVVEMRTEQANRRSLRAARRRRSPAVALAGGASDQPPFPFIVTPVTLPWFDRAGRATTRAAPAAGGARGGSGGASGADEQLLRQELLPRGLAPHVIFCGLAFFEGQRITIDCDAQRLTVGPAPEPQLKQA